MPPNVTGYFSTARGVPYVNGVFQIKFFSQSRQIVGVGIHFVAIPGLRGTAVPSAVMRDHSITALAEEQHLSVPVVPRERPAVTEHDRLPFSPVLVVNR